MLNERVLISDLNELQLLSVDEKAKEFETKGENKKSAERFQIKGIRYIILFTTVLCMAAVRANDTSFSFTYICMTSNSSMNDYDPVLMTTREISVLFGGSGVGALIAVFPVVYALHHLGPRLVFSTLMLLSTSATFALPYLSKVSPIWMLPARVMQGLAFSAVLPLMGCVSAQWSPTAEISKFMTLLSSSNQLAQIFSTPMSAHLCVKSGWKSVFHFHAFVSAIFTVIFLLLFRRSPHEHCAIKQEEIAYITAGEKERSVHRKVPYLRIISTKSVWAVWIAFLGNGFGFQLIIQFMPTFLNKVLGVPITRTGFAGIVPPLTQLFVKVSAGWTSDRITRITELRKIQTFNSLAMIGCGFFFLPLGYLPLITSNKTMQQLIAVLCFTSSTSCLGLTSCGSMKSATLIARDFSHFVMAAVQLLVSIAMLCVPAIVNWLAPESTLQEWRIVFFSFFGLLFFSNAFFCNLCSAEVEPWALSNVIPGESVLTTQKNQKNSDQGEIAIPLIINDDKPKSSNF